MKKKYDEDEITEEELNEEVDDVEEDGEYDDDDDDENGGIGKVVKILAIVLGIIAVVMAVAFAVVKFKKPLSSADSSSHTHIYSEEYTVDKEPTCKERGIESRHCTVEGCDSVTDERKIDKVEHSFDKGKVTKEPTCTEEGEKTYTCKVCGETKKEEIFPIDHAYGPGTVEVEASCLNDGVVVYECTRCGNKKEEKLPKTEHELNAATFTDNTDPTNLKYYRTCKNCGAYIYTDEQGNPLEGQTASAPSDSASTGNSLDQAAVNCKEGKHDFAEVGTRIEPTCTTEGKVTYACRICGTEKSEVLPKKEHNNEEIKVESTCTKQGTLTIKCKDCGYITSTKYLDLADHDFDSGTIVEEGSCSTSRIVKYTCKNCGYTKEENKGTTDEHYFETVNITDGGVEYSVTRCKNCGKEVSRTPIGESPSQQNENGVIIINN